MRPNSGASVRLPVSPPISRVLRRNVDYLVSAVVSTLFLLPMALVAIPGTTRVVGVVYVIVWTLAFVPPMAACMWIVIDSVFMLSNRYPLLLPRAAEDAARRTRVERRAIARLRAIARVWFAATPLSNLAIASLFAVARLRPSLLERVLNDAADRARDDWNPRQPEPQVILAEGAVSRFVHPHPRELEPA
jgi:hypothetical protein